MKRAAFVIAAIACGCGDNSTVCGPGTNDVEGECISTTICGPGTRDNGSGMCVPDATDCQNGTVLIGNACVDPNNGLFVDVEEGPEPNGLGVVDGVENSNNPAGTLTLKPQGETLVIHGHINPFQDADGDGQIDPDFDTYLVTVGGPTLIAASVDGVNGLDGAFYVVGDALGLGSWERFGVSVTGDTAQRPLFLPAAGDYAIIVADTRSIGIGHNPPRVAGNVAAGGPDAQYYMSLTVVSIAPAIPLAVTNNVASVPGMIGAQDIQFYSAPMGLGFNSASLTITTSQANPSVVVLKNNTFRAQGTRTQPASADAAVSVAGFAPFDARIIVDDPSYNTGIVPVAFDLEVVIGDAQPLPTNGSVDELVATTTPATGFDQFNVYFFDVAAPDEIDGLTLHWSQPVDGVVLDEDRFVAADLTIDRSTLQLLGNTFTDYNGAIRFFSPGRYYVVVYPPAATLGSTLTVTSKLGVITPATITENVPLTNQPNNAFDLLPFTYNAGTDIWQSFDVTGTGNRDATFMDPMAAYGSLAPLSMNGGTAIAPVDPPVIFAHTFAGSPSKIGRIIADDPTNQYFIAISAAGAGNVNVDFAKRVFTDLGTVAAGMPKSDASTLTSVATQHLYMAEGDTSNNLDMVLASADLAALHVDILDDNDTPVQTFKTGLRGVGQRGFDAFRDAAAPPVTSNIDYTVSLTESDPFYSLHGSTTAFTDVCATGTAVVFAPDTDDGLSPPLDTPAGFTFYGAAAPKVVVSTNGWVSFDPAVASSSPDPIALPDGVGQISVAPLWEDLFDIAGCTQTTGSRMTVQWSGHDHFGGSAQFQIVLDASTNTIEIVYGATSITGSNATAGVQHAGDNQSTLVGSFSNFVTPNSSLKLTHP